MNHDQDELQRRVDEPLLDGLLARRGAEGTDHEAMGNQPGTHRSGRVDAEWVILQEHTSAETEHEQDQHWVICGAGVVKAEHADG